MNKEQKIKELTEKLQEISKELSELSSQEVEPTEDLRHIETFKWDEYQDYLYISDTHSVAQAEARVELRLFSSRNNIHNVFSLDVNFGEQLNYQKIMNRMWQLAYHFNPVGWDWKDTMGSRDGVYELFFDYESELWETMHLFYYDSFGASPKFKNKQDAQRAADDLNAKGYKL